MIASEYNLLMVKRIAEALGALAEDMVFVGGCSVGLLLTDAGRPTVRATIDVDLVTEVASLLDYQTLAQKLREIGFKQELDAILCRWRYQELTVDIMPTNRDILGFTNRWYSDAIRSAMPYQIPNAGPIRLISPPLFIATKLEAFYGRGGGDYGSSHDIEDIVVVVDGRPELIEEVARSDSDVRNYLRQEIDDLLAESSFVEKIPWHLGPTTQDQLRAEIVIERLTKIAGM